MRSQNRHLIRLLRSYGLTPEEISAHLDIALPAVVESSLVQNEETTLPANPDETKEDEFKRKELDRQLALLPSYVALEGKILNRLDEMTEDAESTSELLSVAKTVTTLRNSGIPLQFVEAQAQGQGFSIQILNHVQ